MTNTLDAVEQTAGIALTQQQQAELLDLYRHLLAHPELSMQETRTDGIAATLWSCSSRWPGSSAAVIG